MRDGENAAASGPGGVSAAIPDGSRPALMRDVTFEDTANGFEVWYSDRIANEHHDLVNESADWLESELGVLNLGQIDYKVLMADGVLTDEIRDGLVAWWAARLPRGTPSSNGH